MAKDKEEAVTPNREDITRKVYPGLTFEEEDLPLMDIEERKRRLSRFARENTFDQFGQHKRTAAIQAIQELNKVDKVYTDFPAGLQDNRTINIYIAGGQDAKDNLELIMEGKLLHGSKKPQEIVEVQSEG